MYRLNSFPIGENFTYAISTVEEGNMSYKYGEFDKVAHNRKSFLRKAEVDPIKTVIMMVKMKDKIIEVGKEEEGKAVFAPDNTVDCDAMITTQKGTALFLIIADCIPMILIDKKRTTLSVIHGGMPNTDLELLPKVVRVFNNKYKIPSSELELLIGPSIQQCSYKYDYFDKKDSKKWRNFCSIDSKKKVLIDNVGLTLKQANDSGIPDTQIYNSNIDTYTANQFYSHKADYDNEVPDQGRFAIVAQLK